MKRRMLIKRKDGIRQHYHVRLMKKRIKLRINEYNNWLSMHDYMSDVQLAESLQNRFPEISENYSEELVRRHRLFTQRTVEVYQTRRRKKRYFEEIMRPKRIEEIPEGDFIAEPKWDGSRMIVSVKKQGTNIFNRRGVLKNKTFPEFDDLEDYIIGDAVIDGEVVAITNEKPYGDFQKLAERDHLEDKEKIRTKSKEIPLTFIAFDILEKSDKDIRNLPLTERKKILERTVKEDNKITETPYSVNPEELLRKVKKRGGEGIVVKEKNSPYEKGLGSAWEKLKLVKENDIIVTGSTPGTGKRKPTFGALKMSVHTKKGLKDMGLVGTGFDDEELKEINQLLKKKKPFVARIKYQRKGSQGKYLSPRFLALRPDLKPSQTHESKIAWKAPYWDYAPIERKKALLSTYFKTEESIKKHINEKWKDLPRNFKEVISDQV